MGIATNLALLARQLTTGGIVAQSALAQPLPQGYLTGLTLSRATATTLGLATGTARNEDAGTARAITLSSAITKGLGAFVAGSGNGSLDTGSIAANTWYHCHIIRRDSDGAADLLLSLSPTAPTMPSGWTARRRIGSIRTDGTSQITDFRQVGEYFRWITPVNDVNVLNPGTTAVLRALTVPPNITVLPIVSWGLSGGTSTTQGIITDPAGADVVPAVTLGQLSVASGGRMASIVQDIPTSNGQLRTRLSASGASDWLAATTFGWIDTRGA